MEVIKFLVARELAHINSTPTVPKLVILQKKKIGLDVNSP